MRDLGITITSDLHFTSHINTIVSKALQRTSILFRGFLSRDIQLMRRSFITYIRPLIEFNSVVWNPTQIFLIDLLESVQRKFTKRIPSLSNLNYLDRLKVINLEPLELRRLKTDLIHYYKFIVLPFNPELKDRFLHYNPPPSSRSGAPYLHKPIRRSTMMDSSFFYRSVHIWNALPAEFKNCTSIHSFKYSIHNYDFTSFLLGSCFKTAWILSCLFIYHLLLFVPIVVKIIIILFYFISLHYHHHHYYYCCLFNFIFILFLYLEILSL